MHPGFFDHSDRLELLEHLGDPLPKLERSIDWEGFRPLLSGLYKKKDKVNQGGRPAFDSVLMFKVLVLQHFYNLSDDQTEFQIRDRYSFSRFLTLTPEARVPDAKTIWFFRERLKKAELVSALFDQLLAQINQAGLIARKGQIVDAAIVPVPKQRNTHEENAQIKAGEKPENWSKNKRSQKDTQARWTQKRGENHYGYKNHISVDNENKIIRKYSVTPSQVHDSQELLKVLDDENTNANVWADSAYQSKEIEEELAGSGYRSHIHRKGNRKHALNDRQKAANRKRSRIRVRVEHVFAQQANRIVRTIGQARAEVKIGMMNLVYNMRRLTFLAPVNG